MKIIKKFNFAFLFCLSIFTILVFYNFNIIVYASEENYFVDNDLVVDPVEYSGYGCTDGKDLQEDNVHQDENTIVESNSGFGCGSTCGASREDGYSTTYQNGCRNWQVMPIISPLNKYWIDESTLSDLTDYQKALFIQNVDKAAAEWNSVRIADCDGAIIKLERQSSNGLNVVPIRYNPNLDSNVAGQFNPIPLFHEIEIKRYNDYDTIMHEFGHMIGLQDLDLNNSPGTHISLMGYNSDDILHYQDIQGLAVANGKHTEHDFRKYYYYDEMYNYVCFYCDATDPRSTKKYDGEHLEYASSCIHEYENLVSAGSRYWQKCTKCYKVVECEFNIKVLSINSVEIVGLIDNRSSVIVPSTIGGQSIVSIGANAFKNCTNLQEVIISNTVTNIDSSAFENCSYLQSVALPSNLVAIGSSAFKGCASLPSITIPNSVTNIDSSAFENCSYLQSAILPNNLVAIGISAFKGCGSLGSIVIPNNVQYIDDSAFENCVSLVSVIVEREISNITNLGNNVFDGCSTSLQIVVPQDRVAEYKNKVYWSSYKSKIVPNNTSYSEIDLNCLIDEEESVTLNAGYNKLYKLVADCTRSYKFVTDVSSKIIVYNSDMTMAYSGDNSLTAYLNKGTYYLSIEHSTITTSGTININYKLAYPTDGTAISYNSTNGTNILSSLHLTENDMCHARLKYTNNQGAGIYKFTLYAGANVIYPEYAIQVYTDADRNNLLSMYSVNELNILAQSNENENIIYVNLPENGTYYIDVTLPSNNYSILTFNVESIEANNINYLNSLSVIGFNVIFENSNAQSYFEEVTISHRSEIQLDILTSGIINNNIKVYVFEKVRDPGYEPGINYYYIETVHINEITSSNSSPVYTIVLNPGTYYFGYAENEDNVNINYALRRMVDYTMNMEDTLVADPYYEGYELGSEVNLNNGLCDNYNITEGFTRNIYLMVEDRLTDPMSRLDYDWYSSNESVAKVTNYGTVLGMPVDEDTTVTIYAVLKADPSIVYYKVFTILNDEEEDLIEIELEMSYSYSEENGEYQLELNSANCPYPMIQYYDWNVNNESNEEVLLNYWGNVTSTGPCEVLIVGTYNLNNRVRIFITLTIEE